MKLLKIISIFIMTFAFIGMMFCIYEFSLNLINLNFNWFFWLLLILLNMCTILQGVNLWKTELN